VVVCKQGRVRKQWERLGYMRFLKGEDVSMYNKSNLSYAITTEVEIQYSNEIGCF